MRKGSEIDEAERAKNRSKSKVRVRVEHVFAVVKRLWGFTKVRIAARQERHALVRGAGAGQSLPGPGALGMSASEMGARRACEAEMATIPIEINLPLSANPALPNHKESTR